MRKTRTGIVLDGMHHITAAFYALVPSPAINPLVLRSYTPQTDSQSNQLKSWIARSDIAPGGLGGFSYAQLTLVSVLGLFLELLMIRWISSEVRVFAYFKNFVLVACFLGFGVGCYLCRRRVSLLAMMVSLVSLAVLIEWPSEQLRFLMSEVPVYIGTLSDVHLWQVPHLKLGFYAISIMFSAILLIVAIFGLVVLVFVPVGQFVGWYLENAERGVSGYSVNILGSLGGIALYTFLCYLDQPPAIWFAVAGVMLVALVWRAPKARWTAAVGILACVILGSVGPPPPSKTYWSPYQKLTLTPQTDSKTGEVLLYDLNTNGAWYQKIVNLSPDFVASHPGLFAGVSAEWNSYNLPYHFYASPPKVLVLGAGMGNDVAAALRHNAGRVVAVEIDPLIVDLGRKLHFEKPYASPRVEVVVDDARSYLQNNHDQFDLIMFSLLDSHTTSSSYSNIRIDNYVYTVEAMRIARRALKPDGLFVVKFQVDTPWIAGRIQGLMREIFGSTPLQIQSEYDTYSTPGRFYIAGSQDRINQALTDPALAAYSTNHRDFTIEPAVLTTDDWPYFYQRRPGIPSAVAIVCGALLIFGFIFLRQTGITGEVMRWHFFFLGAGFMLLESQIISKMALLFGTTWVVNSIVIAGLMLLIIAANGVVEWKPEVGVGIAYSGIFASMIAAYFIPIESYFFAAFWAKALAATAVLCLPVFFAGIVFTRSFARAGFRGEALGSNLLGALTGGLLESLSLWTGIRALLVVAAVLYLGSILTRSTISNPARRPA